MMNITYWLHRRLWRILAGGNPTLTPVSGEAQMTFGIWR